MNLSDIQEQINDLEIALEWAVFNLPYFQRIAQERVITQEIAALKEFIK